MIKDNERQLNRIRAVLDVLTVAAAYFLTYLLFFFVFPSDSLFGGIFSLITARDYAASILYFAPLHLLMYIINHMYRPMRVTGRRLEAFVVFRANLIAIIIVMVFFWLFQGKDELAVVQENQLLSEGLQGEKVLTFSYYCKNFSRMFLFEFGLINTCAIILQRNILRYIMVAVRKKGLNKKTILVVGYSRGAEGFLDRVRNNARWGYQIYGILDDRMPKGTTFEKYEVIGKIDELAEILERNEVDEVFVTLRLREYEKLEEVVHACEKAGVMTKFVPDYGNLMSNNPYTEDLLGLPVIYVRQVPLNDILNAFMKRAMDIIGSLIAIILFSPVMLVTAILVKLSSPGPVIFKQERVGLHNRPFMMYKFRSMGVQREEDERGEWTTKNDPRVTKVGKIIRKTSIDELPQLFNVLSGKMSLVGPRPERPQFVEIFREEIPRYMVKHQVRPGMTGWAQVNGYRGDTSIRGRIDHDIYYIENWSLGLDFKILFLTVFKGFINKNAY
ncbi:MAG: undecaprenyl-phosphate glucose phosphotransferase [Lachnospiraceae bacterium]|nr:undecaprenyl-phosphate glucose phosphotransferase [Lachnospiraceae bacterium]